MRILWLGWEDLYATRRMRCAAETAGVKLDSLEMFDVSFISDNRKAGIYYQDTNLLRREFAGVDIRYKGGQPMILEVNRRPAFEGFEKATGLDVAGKFLDYILNRAKN